jgi:type IV pilus assembly protein PilB
MSLSKNSLKTIFVDQTGLLTPEGFESIVKSASENRQPLEQILMERGFVAPQYYLKLLSEYYKVPSTDLKINDIYTETLHLLPEIFAMNHMVVAFGRNENMVNVAMVDPSSSDTIRAIENSLNRKIQPHVATEHAIKRALVLYKGSISESLAKLLEDIKSKVGAKESDSSELITALLDKILETAVFMEASDVHIEPYEKEIIVRFRVDGLLKSVAILPVNTLQGLIARLKILAGLKIDEKRVPQDGRINYNLTREDESGRVSIVPSMWGEKTVIRVLRKEAQLFDLASIGLLDSDLEIVRKHLRLPFGMILVCGPTGSGKTSTLYAFLQEIGMERIDVVNISTIEDPIEYTIPRVTQIQIHPEVDLTFATGLRSLLRQDPDIIMVGEIRDNETADIAVRAALVGRLLLSTLHTNDAVGVVPRLMDMNVEPYLISSTLSMAIAQRLVRKLCTHCRQSYIPDAKEIDLLRKNENLDQSIETLRRIGSISKSSEIKDLRFYKSVGCEKCDQSGYIGRTAIFEILEVTDHLKDFISRREDGLKIKELALKAGMKTMFADGLAKVLLGITDVKELLRVA